MTEKFKLSKETRFYYLDYLQKQINKLVRRNNIPLATLDQMLFMIMELKKEG
tara:strand:+ start:1013 stop:1168 length:156 start_codon:yes stop_codon:yes gene_type:complete